MPQVKIKQGVKSSINNNAGILNAGTLAITTDTNELFVTHNDGTVHQLCNPVINTDQIVDLAITKPKLSQDTYDWIDSKVDKAGDTMSGDLDMGGNQINNAGFEVVTFLPTTNNFVGRRVTYQGRDYIWNGSAWKNDGDYLEIGSRNLLPISNVIQTSASPLSVSVLNYNITAKCWGYDIFNTSFVSQKLKPSTDYILKYNIKLLNIADGNSLVNVIGRFALYNDSSVIIMGDVSASDYSIIQVGDTITVRSKFITPSDLTNYRIIYYSANRGVTGMYDTHEISELMLIEGNIATNWTPAPEDKVDVIKLPPIPVNSEDRYKYINHRLGRKPDVQLIDESGEIRYVQVIHLSDDSLQLSWVGSIAGSIIIE